MPQVWRDLGTERQIECLRPKYILYFAHPIGHVPVININLHGYENNRR